MSAIWITADTHYNHKNIVRGCSEWQDLSRCRNFKSLEKHNETLVKNINNVVKDDDWLYHLGDWSFMGKDSIFEFRVQLRCQNIVLVMGNHDIHIIKNALVGKDYQVPAKELFHSTHDRLEKKWADNKFVLDHYPIYSWHNKADGAIHLYGHTHEDLDYDKRAVCVSIDCHPQFRPFHLSEILEIIKKREK